MQEIHTNRTSGGIAIIAILAVMVLKNPTITIS